jgi:hypothetical protein
MRSGDRAISAETPPPPYFFNTLFTERKNYTIFTGVFACTSCTGNGTGTVPVFHLIIGLIFSNF